MSRLHRCRFPGCHQAGYLARMPFVDRWVWVCDRHRPWALLVAMREVIG